LSITYLDLDGPLDEEWNGFIKELNLNGICLNSSEDLMVWSWDTSMGNIKANMVYKAISNSILEKDIRWWSNNISKWRITKKLKCFAWPVLHNKIVISQNLQKKGFAGVIGHFVASGL